jgi:glycosyltransferase involved in cell wall biosynthesis
MKIVQITTDSREHFKQYSLPEPYFGTAPHGLLRGFEQIPDHEIHVISCSHQPTHAPEKIAQNIWFHQPIVGNYGWGKSLFSGCVLACRRLIAKIQPDIVHGQGTEKECALAAMLSGVTNVVTLHGNMRIHASRPEHNRSLYYKTVAFLEGLVLRHTDAVVAVSSFTKKLVSKETKRCVLIPNAVDPTYFEIKPDCPIIPRFLFVGTIAPHKNPIGLIEACEPLLRSRRCEIAIAGSGNMQSAYGRSFNDLVESIPGVTLLGFLDREDLKKEYQRSTALIHPTFEDNCPMTVIEAMACGLPVLASAIGGVPDLVQHGMTGILFDPTRPCDILDAVDQLIHNPDIGKEMGSRAKEVAHERFHPLKVAQCHISLYEELIAKSYHSRK